MNKPSLLFIVTTLAMPLAALAQDAATYEVQESVAFAHNSAKLSDAAQKKLRDESGSLSVLLRYRPESSVEIAGYADPGEKKPGPLADSRAQTVWEYLISLGLPAERMEPVGYGAAPGAKAGGRVDVRVAAEDALAMSQFAQPLPAPAAEPAAPAAAAEPMPPAAAAAAAPSPQAPATAVIPPPAPTAPVAALPSAPPAPSSAELAAARAAQQHEDARMKAEQAAADRRARAAEQAHAQAEQQEAARQARLEAQAQRKAQQQAALERAQAAAQLRKEQQAEAAAKKAQEREEARQQAAQNAAEKKKQQEEAAAEKKRLREEARLQAAQNAAEKKKQQEEAAIREAMAVPPPALVPEASDAYLKSAKGAKIIDNQFSSSYTRPPHAAAPKSALPGEGSYFIQGTAYFSANARTLTPGSAGTLDALAQRLQKMIQGNPNLRVNVVGHADPLTEAGQADVLAEARAEELVTQLAERGVDRSHLHPAGAADTQPLTSKKGDPARGLNMRAEIRVPN